jgi:hypothetical protein
MAADYTLPSENVWHNIAWDTEELDRNDADGEHMHGDGEVNSLITFRKSGSYLISLLPVVSSETDDEGEWGFRFTFTKSVAPGATPVRIFSFRDSQVVTSGLHCNGSFTWIEKFTAGDTLTIAVMRTSTGSPSMGLQGGIEGTRFSAVRIGRR